MQAPSAADPAGRRAGQRRRDPGIRRAWCCSFGVVPQSPENRGGGGGGGTATGSRRCPPAKPRKPPYAASFHSSPSPSSRVGRGLMDPRRILSPGRVSPIDSDAPLGRPPQAADPVSVAAAGAESEAESVDATPKEKPPAPGHPPPSSSVSVSGVRSKERFVNPVMDLRLSLKGKDGRCLVLELDSEVLCRSSTLFAAMVLDVRRRASDASAECQRIEVAEVEDLLVFKDTIELMYEKDAMRWLARAGVPRSIDILEVSSTIMFNRGVVSCLNYLEAVPWNESEEEKLKILFSRCSFDEPIVQDLLDRLYPQGPANTQGLALRLIHSVANGTNSNARKVSQTLINGLLSKSSVYQKDAAGLDKDGLYSVCNSCLNSLMDLFADASVSFSTDHTTTMRERRPTMIERVSRQVDNLNWLLEILIEKQLAENFVGIWASQTELVMRHERVSPMIRYELGRISACVFIALGRGKLQCPGGIRYALLRAWFRPMLLDFGWLQRCSKGLDMRMLEESLGQLILTLSLRQQQALFVEWFRCFSVQGSECPNLSKAFQVWWRRSFVRAPDARG